MTKDWKKIFEKYKGKWVALDEEGKTVLGFGQTAHEALEQAKKNTRKTPYLVRMPEKISTFVGLI